MKELTQYPFEIHPFSQEEGGGYLISFTDFSECISDGETIEEAIQNGLDALAETIAALEELGHPVPEPASSESYIVKETKGIINSLSLRIKRPNRSPAALVLHSMRKNVKQYL